METQTQPIITHARHRVHLESALRFLQAFSRLREFLVLLALLFSPLAIDSYSSIPLSFSGRRSRIWRRRAPIRSPSRRESIRVNRRRRCSGCCVQGFLYREIKRSFLIFLASSLSLIRSSSLSPHARELGSGIRNLEGTCMCLLSYSVNVIIING